MAGRPVAPGRQEEEAKDHGLKLSAARPLGHLPSIDETRPAGLGPASRRGSVLGPVLSFSRRNSLAGPSAGPGGRRPSLGPVPPLGSRVSFSGLPLAPARQMAPSYRTEPAPGERWETARAQQALEAALAEGLRDACYSGAEAGRCRGAQVPSLVGELDPTCHSELFVRCSEDRRSRVPQLKMKEPGPLSI